MASMIVRRLQQLMELSFVVTWVAVYASLHRPVEEEAFGLVEMARLCEAQVVVALSWLVADSEEYCHSEEEYRF